MKNDYKSDFNLRTREFSTMLGDILSSSYVRSIARLEYIEMNAKFIYLLALFERFIGHLNIYSINSSKLIKDKYVEMFSSVCEQKIKSEKDAKEWRQYFNRPSKMIKDYAILEKEKNGLVILRSILKDKVNFAESMLQNDLKYYYEARARRNLLAHRGRAPDQIYFEDIKRNNIDKQFHEKILKKGLYSRSTSLSKMQVNRNESINDLNNLIDLSITPRFLTHTCMTLFGIMIGLLMDLKHDAYKSELHDLIKFGIKKNDIFVLGKCFALFQREIGEKCNKDSSNLSIESKVNYIILREYLINKKLIKNAKPMNQRTINLIESIDPSDHELAEYVKVLLLHYVKKDKVNFYKTTKKMMQSNKESAKHTKNWLIFHKYIKNKDFKEILDLR